MWKIGYCTEGRYGGRIIIPNMYGITCSKIIIINSAVIKAPIHRTFSFYTPAETGKMSFELEK